MTPSKYREQDYAFGQRMLALRSSMGLTQAGVAQALGVSRRSVADWEAGLKYPKAVHLKPFVALAISYRAFQAGHEADDIRLLWKAACQKELLNEAWLAEVLAGAHADAHGATSALGIGLSATEPTDAAPPSPEHTLNSRLLPRPLPFHPTPFVGRSAELAAIARLLANPACRLLTLHGPGGVGKTRLALEVAANTATSFPDGVAFVALAAISKPDQIVSAIGDALQIVSGNQADPIAHLLGQLRERHLLLVLDNFEHVLDGADLVAVMLAHAPHIKVVATSRERLNLQAEWLFTVDGLGFPHQQPYIQSHTPAMSQNPATLMEYSAVELFVQRAGQVLPALQLNGAALTSIVRICQHVAGIPLAIELAAASARVESIPEIERQIRANLDVLATRLRDVPPRHRSMRAVFDHSWSLLSEAERALFGRLAVFHSGWTAKAAAVVAGATTDLLIALVDKSLVRVSHVDSSSMNLFAANFATDVPETRYTMLEPIRAYALEQLAAQGEEARVRDAHAHYYLALAEAAAAEWGMPTKEEAIVRQTREHSNMRAALQWAYDTGNSAVGLRFALALWRFWRSFGYKSEGRAWIAQLLSLDQNAADEAATSARERALHAAAWLASDQHDFASATQLFEQSLALRRTRGEAAGQAAGQTSLADVLRNAARQARAAGQYTQAAALLEESLARHRMVGDRTGGRTTAGSPSLEGTPDEVGQTLRELATVRREQGDFVRATALFEQALALHRAIDDRTSVAFTWLGLGDVARDQGDSAGVRAYCEPALTILREVGVQWAIGFALNNLALAAYAEHDLARAVPLIHESVALFRVNAAKTSLAEVLVTLGAILWAQGDARAAYDALTEALRLASSVGPRLFAALALEGLAQVVVSQGDAMLATRLIAGASALRLEMGAPMRPVDRAGMEQTTATARAMLGDEAFARTWAEAPAPSPEQILSAMVRLVSRGNVR